MNEFQWPRLDKTKFSVVSLYDREDDLQYWKNATPEERLEAMELMRADGLWQLCSYHPTSKSS